MKCLPLTFLLLIHIAATAQTDSLFNALQKLSDTAQVNALNEAGRSFWISGQDSLAEYCLNRSIAIAKSTRFFEGEARARLQLVRIELDYMTSIEAAHAHLDTVLQLAEKSRNKLLEGQTYFRRAQLYGAGFSEHAQKSREFMEKARQIFVALGDKVWEGAVYVELAENASTQGKYAEAIDLLLKARRLQEASGEISALRATLPNLGVTYTFLEMYDEALECFNDAEKTAIALNDERIKAFVYSQRAAILQKKKRYNEAKSDLQAAISIYNSLGGTYYLTGVYTRLGEVYFELDSIGLAQHYARAADNLYREQMEGEQLFHHPSNMLLGKVALRNQEYKRAIATATEGIKWAEDYDPPLTVELAEYHRQLAVAYEGVHDYKAALFHQKTYKSYSDSILNKEALQRTRVAALTYDFEKQQQSDRFRIQELENQKLKNTQNMLIGISILGIIAVVYITWSNRRLRRRNKEIVAKNREIEKALDKGQRIERKRVASELHDNLNTKLAAIRWNIEAMKTEDFGPFNRKIYDRIIDMVGDAYEDVRLISHNMLPAELETKGLADGLRILIQRLSDHPSMHFDLKIEDYDQRLPLEVEFQLYNITLELINNALKHSEAAHVWILLQKEQGGLLLSVTDDGVGMSLDEGNHGRGFHNLRGRAEAIHGVFTVDQPQEGGTRATIFLPEQ